MNMFIILERHTQERLHIANSKYGIAQPELPSLPSVVDHAFGSLSSDLSGLPSDSLSRDSFGRDSLGRESLSSFKGDHHLSSNYSDSGPVYEDISQVSSFYIFIKIYIYKR